MDHRKHDIAAIVLAIVVAMGAGDCLAGQDQVTPNGQDQASPNGQDQAPPNGVVITKPSSNTESPGQGHTNVEIFTPGTHSTVQPPPKEFYEGSGGEAKKPAHPENPN